MSYPSSSGITIVDIETRQRFANRVFAGDVDESMTFYALPTSSKTVLKDIYKSLQRSAHGRKIIACIVINVVATAYLFIWSQMSNSLAMAALAFMTLFDLTYQLTAALSIWARSKSYSSVYSYGYERFEVLAVFSSTMLAQLGSFFLFKESTERIFEPHHIHIGKLPLGAGIALLIHTFVIYQIQNQAFQHVIHASSSSWLQEHVSDISESVCHLIPALSRLLLPRINPFLLLGCASSLCVFSAYLAVDLKGYEGSDVVAALCIGIFNIATMYPMAAYTGKILLQSTPSHLISQLDKCMREICTLDGVLEFRNEHFWTVGFGKMAGSVHVRVRRDSNDQLVLAHVYSRLSALIHHLTVHIFKDDWSRSTAYQIIQNTSIPPITPVKQNPQPYTATDASFVQVPWTSTPYGTPAHSHHKT